MADKDNIHLSEDGEAPEEPPELGSGQPRFSTDRIANKNHLFLARKPASLILPVLLGILLIILAVTGAYYFFIDSSLKDNSKTVKVESLTGAESVEKSVPGKVLLVLETKKVVAAPKPVPVQPILPGSESGVLGDHVPEVPPKKTVKPSPSRVLGPANIVVKNKPDPLPADHGRNSDRYILQGGAFIVKANLAAAEKAIRSLGFEPHHKSGRNPVKMIRLRIGRYSPDEGRAKVQELKKIAPGAFVIKEGELVVVYAGSYHMKGKAAGYAETLALQGVQVEEESVEIVLPVTTLTFGGFPNMSTARQAAERARRHGMDIIIVEQQ